MRNCEQFDALRIDSMIWLWCSLIALFSLAQLGGIPRPRPSSEESRHRHFKSWQNLPSEKWVRREETVTYPTQLHRWLVKKDLTDWISIGAWSLWMFTQVHT